MRRPILIFVAVFVAAGLTSFVSLFVVSEARSQASPEETSGGSEPYHQLVDNATAGSFEAPGWHVGRANANTFGEDYAYADPSDAAGPARFTVNIPENDNYAVFARWPGGKEVTRAARFGIDTGSGVRWDKVDQRIDANYWVLIGVYEMEPGQRTIEISRGASGAGRLMADAVMVVGGGLIAPDGQTATTADPDALAGDELAAGEDSISTQDTISTQGGRGPTGRTVVRTAERHLGTRYGHERCRIDVEEDCSCHTKLVFKRFGYNLPDSPVKQYKMRIGRNINQKSDLRAGDLVFNDLNGGGMDNEFRDHVSIYAGNGWIIHASSYFNKVARSELQYLDGFKGGKRLRLR